MIFNEETLRKLHSKFQTVPGKRDELSIAYIRRDYTVDRAREHAQHGFLRRVQTLVRCIENTFTILPPNLDDIPEREKLSDVTINLQAFVFNVFGCIDNLAWIWVCEKNITEPDGSPIRNGWIGLRKMNTLVRKSFSLEFRKYLIGLDDWFDYHEDYRHALAHRIPLYISPHVVTPRTEAAYQDLENGMFDASRRDDPEEYERLSAEQKALVEFRPLMMHSFGERANPVAFHCQLLTDFITIHELGLKMIEELDRQPPTTFRIPSKGAF